MTKEDVTIDFNSNNLYINVIIDDKEIRDMLYNKDSNEKVDMIKRSIKIGMIALKNAVITIDTNYVKKELERLTADVDKVLKENLGSEGMKGSLDSVFGINGSFETNLKGIFKNHEIMITEILSENNVNSPLYKIRKFIEENSKQTDNRIYVMLDPGNKESLLSRLKDDIIRKIDEVKKSGDIDTINKLVENIKISNKGDSEEIKRGVQGLKEDYANKFIDIKKSFHEEIGSVKDIVNGTNVELAKLIKENQVVDMTTLKGMKFEDVLFGFLSTKALTKYGDTIDIVNLSGGDKAGDIIINIKGSQEKIVVKAESTSKENVQMNDTIFKQLNNTMKERSTEYGIKVYENELPERIGPILVGDNKIVCSFLRGYTSEGYPLEVAYELLRSAILRKSMGIDREDVKMHIDNIVRSLNSVQHITGNLTKMENICANTKSQVEELRQIIGKELDQMLMKSTGKDSDKKDSDGQEVTKKKKGKNEKAPRVDL